jgi:hypothetical protein
MGYRAVVEWVKGSPDRAMGVVPGTLHVRMAVGRSLTHSALSHLALGRAATGVRTRTCRARPRGEGDQAHTAARRARESAEDIHGREAGPE